MAIEDRLPCPNPECRCTTVLLIKPGCDESSDLKNRDYFCECDDCCLRGPSCDGGPEAERLWNLLPRNDMRLVDRVNELVQAEEALTEENVELGNALEAVLSQCNGLLADIGSVGSYAPSEDKCVTDARLLLQRYRKS